MKVLICGGRFYNNRQKVFDEMDRIITDYFFPATICNVNVIVGDAVGADDYGYQWAVQRRYLVRKFYADWKKHKNAAGVIRNAEMIEQRPDLVVAFPGGKGTMNCIRQAYRKHIRVIEVADADYPPQEKEVPKERTGFMGRAKRKRANEGSADLLHARSTTKD